MVCPGVRAQARAHQRLFGYMVGPEAARLSKGWAFIGPSAKVKKAHKHLPPRRLGATAYGSRRPLLAKTSGIRKVSQRRSRGVGGRKGQLDRFDDGTWEFFGNGETTTAEVAENIIEYERNEGNGEYEEIKSAMLAQLLLEDPENALLHRSVDGDVNKAIPVNQTMLAEGESLKKIVAQLMAHEKALRQTLIEQASDDGKSATEKTLGNVPGVGLTLPYEP